MTTDPAALLEALDPEQRIAAEALRGPVCLLAGAGTGKTRAITHRIAYGVATGAYSPARVMALTFTSRAAGELRSRLRALGAAGVSARTFHAAALSQLSYFWPQVVGGSLPSLLDSKARLIAHAADGLRLRLDTAALRDASAEIEWRKVSRLTLEQYAQRHPERSLPAGLGLEAMLDLHRAYEALKDERRQLDFEDVLLATAGMLELEPRVLQQVHEQYRVFVVDEYQDVSPLQHDLLQLWLGDRRDLCVVGDASQTIYSFAGASASFLLGFEREFPEATIVRLERNHRSSAPLIDAANRLMLGRPGALELTAAGEAPGPPVLLDAHRSDGAEARAVADRIAEMIGEGVPAESIAILYRVNSQSALLEAALEDRGVSSRMHGASRFFDRPEVKRAMLELRGYARAEPAGPLFKHVSDILRSQGWTQDPPEQRGAIRERWEALNALVVLADEAPEGTTLSAFVDDLFERQQSQHEPTVAAVTLATIHSAKGLEWDHVFIVGLSEGMLPIMHATDEAAIEEERRLLYVGITRARRSLRLSWAAESQHRSGSRSPSRFLQALRIRTADASTAVDG